jgi:hypothetical protein
MTSMPSAWNLIALLVLTIAATSNSAVIHSPKGFQNSAIRDRLVENDNILLANHAMNSNDRMHDQIPITKTLNSYTIETFKRKLLSDFHASDPRENKDLNLNHKIEIKTQARKFYVSKTNDPSKIISTDDPSNEPAIGSRLRRDIVFTAPPDVVVTIAPRKQTTRPQIIVIQTPSETTAETPPSLPSTETIKPSEPEQSSTTSEGSVTDLKKSTTQPSSTEAEEETETQEETEEKTETSATELVTPQPSTTEMEETETQEETETSATEMVTPQPELSTTEAGEETKTETEMEEETETSAIEKPSTTEAREETETETVTEEETETTSTETVTPQPSTTQAEGETETMPIEDNDEFTTTKEKSEPPPIKGTA